MVSIVFLLLATAHAEYFGSYYCKDGKDVFTHLFEWKWTDIADECENFLADHGYCAVQVCLNYTSVVLFQLMFNYFLEIVCVCRIFLFLKNILILLPIIPDSLLEPTEYMQLFRENCITCITCTSNHDN